MDADAVVSPLDIPQAQRKRLDFILFQKPTYERWVEARKKCNKNFKDSDFAEYLLDNLEQTPRPNRFAANFLLFLLSYWVFALRMTVLGVDSVIWSIFFSYPV